MELTLPESQRGTAARSAGYRILSSLFRYPRDAAPTPQDLRAWLDDLPHDAVAMEEMAQLLGELDSASQTPLPLLAATYTALFDNCRGRSAVSLYEKDYGNGDAKMVWEELIRFYEHFGLGFDVRHSHDWPDHIGTELEFMHYLSFLEAAAPAADRPLYVRAQQDFLSRRLARWAGRFAAQANGAANGTVDSAPYGLFARLVKAFVAADADYLGCSVEQSEHWVPMQNLQSDANGRTVIPITNLSETEAFRY